jgi:hypothetical protein
MNVSLVINDTCLLTLPKFSLNRTKRTLAGIDTNLSFFIVVVYAIYQDSRNLIIV